MSAVKVLVTGANGFLATNVVNVLLSKGYKAVSYTHLTLPTICSV